MKSIRQGLTRLALLCITSTTALGAAEEEASFPSLTDVGPYETPSRYASGTITYNLGPTGCRGWARTYNGGKRFWGENGREVLITRVDPGSPGAGRLQVFDVIVGAEGNTFDRDALVCLGNAIAAAQRADGVLLLQRWRNGTVGEVALTLPQLPGDSPDSPLVAEHSAALRSQCLAFLADSMHPDGFQMHSVYASLNALYLLAHGKPEHLDHVRRHIRRIVDNMEESEYGPWNWVKGCDTTLMAEYFLATGDRTVLPAIERNCQWMRNSRSYAGGFGHGGPYGGYGHVGLPGMFCAIGATLARECGVTGYNDVIGDAQRFYARAAGLGKMGYGGFDADTHLKTLYGDNGKSGTAAVLYSALGDTNTSRTYANTAGALAAYSESGHSGHFWSFSWGSLGANMGDRAYRQHYARELDWYYALARTWRGGLTAQPWLASMGSYAGGGEEIATGGMALWYCLPLRSLRILGGEKSVFSEELVDPLAEARQRIYEKKHSQCMAALNDFKPGHAREQQQAGQLRAIAEKALETIALTRQSIRANIDKGDLFPAERQLNALKPILNGPDEQVEQFEQLLKREESKEIIDAGRKYYDAMQREGNHDLEFFYRAPAIVFNAQKREAMQQLADSANSGRYATMAATALGRWEVETSEPTFKTLVEHTVESIGDDRLYLGRDADAKHGVHYTYVEFDTTPETPQAIRALTPVKEGTVRGFDLSVRKRDTNFGIVYRTWVEVTDPADYRFTLTSDDGSALSVDGRELIDNGGLHGMVPKQGTIRLSPGRHELECIMFQAAHGYGLRVDMARLMTPKRTSDANGAATAQTVSFQIDDPTQLQKLKLRVKASDAVTVYLNEQIICRFHKKRQKHMFDGSWGEWEDVTLRPEALKLLRAGENRLAVTTAASQLGAAGESVGVQLQGLDGAE